MLIPIALRSCTGCKESFQKLSEADGKLFGLEQLPHPNISHGKKNL